MRERVARREPEKHIDVRQPQVAIEQHAHAPARGERGCQIHRDAGLADAAFAAGDGDDLDRACARPASLQPSIRLISREGMGNLSEASLATDPHRRPRRLTCAS